MDVDDPHNWMCVDTITRIKWLQFKKQQENQYPDQGEPAKSKQKSRNKRMANDCLIPRGNMATGMSKYRTAENKGVVGAQDKI